MMTVVAVTVMTAAHPVLIPHGFVVQQILMLLQLLLPVLPPPVPHLVGGGSVESHRVGVAVVVDVVEVIGGRGGLCGEEDAAEGAADVAYEDLEVVAESREED